MGKLSGAILCLRLPWHLTLGKSDNEKNNNSKLNYT